MGWEYTIAGAIKETGVRAREKATEDTSLYIGVIEKLSPMIVTVMGGEGVYTEGQNLYVTRTVKDYRRDVSWPVTTSHVPGEAKREKFLKTGMEVLLAPVGNVDAMAAIDILEE